MKELIEQLEKATGPGGSLTLTKRHAGEPWSRPLMFTIWDVYEIRILSEERTPQSLAFVNNSLEISGGAL